MNKVKEKPKESKGVPKMTSGVSRLLVESFLPEVPGLTRKIHHLHDHDYRINFSDLVSGKIVKSHYITVHPDKSLTIHDD